MVEVTLPEPLATPARIAAITKAQYVRQRREEIVEAIADGLATIDGVLAADADRDIIEQTKILPLVESVPHMGKVTSRRLLGRLNIAETTTVVALATNDVSALLIGIEEHHDG